MTDDRSRDPPPPRPPRQRNGCLAALLIVFGSALLLPGICALGFASSDPSMLKDSTGLVLLFVCLAIGAGGVALIWAGARQA
jgi:hypothetical protein